MSRIRVASSLLPLLLAACWAEQHAITDEDRPASVAPRPSDEPASRPSADLAGGTAAGKGTSAGAGFATPSETTATLPTGLIVIVRAQPGGDGPLARTATARIVLPAGRRHARTGQIDLAAGMLLFAAEQGQPSLERAIEQLGGTATCSVGARDVAIDLVVPRERLQVALDCLAVALQREPRSDSQLELVRLRVLRDWRRRFATSPLDSLVRRLLANPAVTPGEYVARAQESTIDDVKAAWLVMTRPAGATLAISIAGANPDAVATVAKASLAPWSGGSPTRGIPVAAGSRPEREASGELIWAQDARSPRAALVLRRPELGDKHDVELLVLQQCLTRDGVGGRLASALERMVGTPPRLEPTVTSDGARRLLLLELSATPEQVVMLNGALRLALESMARERPEGEELVEAAARARLWLLEDESDPGQWVTGACARTTERRPSDAGAKALARLADPQLLSLGEAIPELSRSIVALLVLGGAPPAGAKVTVLEQPAPPDRVASALDADVGERERAARPLLELAVQAIGGPALLGSLSGYAASCEVRSTGAVVAKDKTWYRDDGRLRRVRRVLATTLEAVVAKGTGAETAGDQNQELTSDEATSLLQRAGRHPVALLADWVHGKSRFKLVSQREIEGREMAILELIDATRERLRIQIDAQSGLIRLVETREHWPGVGRVQIVEALSDYRTHRGLRAPFRMVTTIEGSLEPIVTTWDRFHGIAPKDRELERGGPDELDNDKDK